MNKNFTVYLNRIEDELSKALPQMPEAQWINSSFGQLYTAVNNSHLLPLLTPTRSLVSLGGKRWRPLLLVLIAKAYNQTKETEEIAFHLTPLVEFVHTASLIHDDIEDSSDTRRGKPAAYITYGIDTALNAGSWLYFEAPVCIYTSNCSTEQKKTLYEAYTNELRRLHLGQAMDITWHNDNKSYPTQDEYLAMVRCKTGTLASLSARIGILAAGGTKEEAEEAATTAANIGAGFQIIDDVTNLTTGNPGKKRGDDIVEGKKSLPVLLYCEHNKNNKEALNTLAECFIKARSEGINSPYVEKAISILSDDGVILEAKNNGINLIKEGCQKFTKILGESNESAQITDLFYSMADIHESINKESKC